MTTKHFISKTHQCLIMLFLLVVMIPNVLAINTINKVSVNPTDSLQGGNIDICADITSNGNPTVNVIITKPSGQIVSIPLFPSTNKCYQTLNGSEYYTSFTDTNQIGNFTGIIESIKGSEYSNKSITFKTTPISVLIDYVQRVAEVDKVKEVESIKYAPANIKVLGTEYIPNEPATVFLQLVDNQGLPELDGDCHLDIFEPLNNLSQHPYLISDAPMVYNGNDDGVYYYDLITPNKTGVYMLSATCSYAYGSIYIYEPSELESNYPLRNSVIGTYSGNELFLNRYDDYSFTECTSSGGGTKYCEADYTFNGTNHITLNQLQNVSDINLYYMGESNKAGTIIFYYWNWSNSSWVTLPNTLLLSGLSSLPTGVSNFQSNSLPIESLNNNTGIIRVKVQASFGSAFTLYNNYLSVKLLTSTGNVQDLKGSSEIHISNLYDYLSNQNLKIPELVWNYTTRNLTYYEDVTNYTLINEITNNTQDFNDLKQLLYSINNTLYFKIDNESYRISDMLQSVNNTIYLELQLLNYTNSERFNSIDNNLSTINSNVLSTNTSLFDTISSVNASLSNTIYSVNQSLSDKMDVYNTLIYNFINTTYNSLLSSISNIPLNVWTYGGITNYNIQFRPTTFTDPNSIGTNEVNAYDNNVVTYANILVGGVIGTSYVNYLLFDIPQSNEIINSGNITLDIERVGTSINDVGLVDYSVNNGSSWTNCYYIIATQPRLNVTCNIVGITNISTTDFNNNFIVRVGGTRTGSYDLTSFNLYETYATIDYDVSTYRSLTQFTFDNTNYTLIQSNQYNYSGEFNSLELRFDSVDNQLLLLNSSVNNIVSNVWSYNNRTLTYYPIQLDLTNYSLITDNVWSYSNRTLSSFVFDNTDYSLIIDSLNDSLSFNTVIGLISAINDSIIYRIDSVDSDVWIYNNRNLTYYPEQTDLTNYSQVAISVWDYSNKNLTYYEVNNISVSDVWSYINRTLTYYEVNNITTTDVWTYNNRTLTYYPTQYDLTNYTLIQDNQYNYSQEFINLNNQLLAINNSIITRIDTIDSDVWTYIDRNLTYYPQQYDLTNYSQIVLDVWNYNNKTLDYYEVNNITASDVWSYINRTLTYYDVNNITANDVWTYNNRTLTYYPTQSDLTNYTQIVEDVWNATARYTHGVILN